RTVVPGTGQVKVPDGVVQALAYYDRARAVGRHFQDHERGKTAPALGGVEWRCKEGPLLATLAQAGEEGVVLNGRARRRLFGPRNREQQGLTRIARPHGERVRGQPAALL